MLKNRVVRQLIRWTLKIVSAVVSFVLIALCIQPFFVPKYLGDSTTIVKGYSSLEEDSLDVLFLGASQMFCSVDAGRLTEEYGISSYAFGASAQVMCITPYYLEEALKTQHPKLVMVEICKIFSPKSEVSSQTLAWNYAPTEMSVEKFRSLQNVLNGDNVKALQYAYAPLLRYHDRWSTLDEKDVQFVLHPEVYTSQASRGFLSRDHVEKREIAFFSDDTEMQPIPEESREALQTIARRCEQEQIRLVFYKAPVSNWTQGDSLSVKQLMEQNGWEFIDLNEHMAEIGIDPETDFYNDRHLNVYGAEKTTDYLAKLIQSYGIAAED